MRSSLSIVEILIGPYNKNLKKYNRFNLSKGYSVLALYCTFFEKKLTSPGGITKLIYGNKKKIVLTTGYVEDLVKNIRLKKYINIEVTNEDGSKEYLLKNMIPNN
tara:strand:- start:33 stop:347 length:315 start_codon:yes stop_codon:yes gene_type:complete